MNPTFIERNQMLLDKYGHLLDNAKHYTGEARLNELEENKMALLMDNAVRAACTEYGVDYNTFDISKIEEDVDQHKPYTATPNIATFVRTKLAMIGQVFPNMMSREIVSVQPIPQPSYVIFFNDFKRGDRLVPNPKYPGVGEPEYIQQSVADGIHDARNYADNKEYGADGATDIKTITFEITSEAVTAETKKLKGNVTIEVEQDLMAYHGMAAMSLVTGQMGAELTREWDRTIIADLFAAAKTMANFNMDTLPADVKSYQDRRFWMETLFETFVDVDTQIFKKRYRKTNYMIVPADVGGFIEKIEGFVPDTVSVDRKVIKTGGRYYSGTLRNRWRVYVDPFIEDEILMGYNNPADWTETSYVFSPYEMAYLSPEVVNPHTLVKTRAVMSRAARKVVIGDLLGKVVLRSS